MPKCAGCTGGSSGCNCLVTAGYGGVVITGGDGDLATPFIVNVQPDYFGAFIETYDVSLDVFPRSATFNDTRLQTLGKFGGSLTVNIEPVTLIPGGNFEIKVGAFTKTTYQAQITLFFTSTDCTEKLYAGGTTSVPDTDGVFDDDIVLEALSETIFGVDLSLDQSDDDAVLVVSAAGGCYSGQVLLEWFAF